MHTCVILTALLCTPTLDSLRTCLFWMQARLGCAALLEYAAGFRQKPMQLFSHMLKVSHTSLQAELAGVLC